MSVVSTDVAVVGAGPIGLELAVALTRAGIDYLHFDAKQIGQTISWFAPQTRFFSSNERIAIAGVPLQSADQSKSTREEYLAYLRGVVQQFDLQIRTYEPVTAIGKETDGFLITTSSAGGTRACRARRLVLVTGGTAEPNYLGAPGENLPHVSHYFTDPHPYFRKRLLVVGGKNSAVEAALRCYYAGAHVTLSYRQGALDAKKIKYWLMPEISNLIEMGKIQAHFNTCVGEIMPASVRLVGYGANDDGPREVPADFVLLLTGYVADMSLCRLAGVELVGDEQIPRFNPATMETNIPGLFVAGTVVGGTQRHYRVFIENCHVHVERIMAALMGNTPPRAPPPLALPES